MKKLAFRDQQHTSIFLFLVALIFIYFVGLPKMIYLIMPWQKFGRLPIQAVETIEFTPNEEALRRYKDPSTLKIVICNNSVAYLKSNDQDIYRCCDSTEKIISCVNVGIRNNPSDKTCEKRIRNLLYIPDSHWGAKDYKVFASCPSSGGPSALIVQINDDNELLWKFIDVLIFEIFRIVDFGLHYFIGPILFFALAGAIKRKLAFTAVNF